MSFLNLKQLLTSAVVVLGALVSVQIVSGLFSPAVSVLDVEVPLHKTSDSLGNMSKRDFSPLFTRYEVLQPEPKPDIKEQSDNNVELEALALAAANQAKKVLKPNFYGLNEEYQIGLVAVFEQPEKFAVLQLLNYQSGQSEFKKLSEGSEIGSYQLSKIDRLSILLTDQTSQIELFLFKPRTQL
jgi:hypothetical protein